MKELNKAIMSKFNTSNSFNTAIGGRLTFGFQPQGTSFPYAVFNYIGNYPEHLFDDDPVEMISLQLSIFSSESSVSSIIDLLDKARSLFDDCKLSIDNYNHYVFSRSFDTYMVDPERNIWQGVIEYDVWLEKT